MRLKRAHLTTLALTASLALTGATAAYASGGSTSGGGGGGGTTAQSPKVDSLKVDKAYTNATPTSGGEMLIKASSSDSSARLFAYRPDGVLIGEVQNGGGSQYGGTVRLWQSVYSASITVQSSEGPSSRAGRVARHRRSHPRSRHPAGACWTGAGAAHRRTRRPSRRLAAAPADLPARGRYAAVSRCGSFQPGRGKWQL